MFTPAMSTQREVQSFGNKGAKIAIVGDYTDAFDKKSLRPFSGPGGSVLEQCLHAAGLIRGECYMTNMVKLYTNPAQVVDDKKKRPGPEFAKWADRINQELDEVDANVIVACGNAPFLALTGVWGVSQYRGYVFETNRLKEKRKVIPTYPPAASVRGMYTYRYIISCDLKKAKHESLTRQLIRPDRQLIYRYDNVSDAMDWLNWLSEQPVVSFDIEVLNFSVSCISFSSRPDIACVIPIAGAWSEEDELQIWRGIQKVLGNPNSIKVAQNSIFDIQFLLAQHGVVVRGEIHDTMIAHSVTYPELQKGLGFLGSIYCGTQAYWKDKVKFSNIKDES